MTRLTTLAATVDTLTSDLRGLWTADLHTDSDGTLRATIRIAESDWHRDVSRLEQSAIRAGIESTHVVAGAWSRTIPTPAGVVSVVLLSAAGVLAMRGAA